MTQSRKHAVPSYDHNDAQECLSLEGKGLCEHTAIWHTRIGSNISSCHQLKGGTQNVSQIFIYGQWKK